jgi:Abnormal spindle-like microcephaly-assoc'd, ASPM-SPD-2-Hydin
MRLPQSTAVPFRLVSTAILITASALLGFGSQTGNQLKSSPWSLVFGGIQVSQSLTQTLTLTNSGNKSVSISAITVNNPAFAVSGLTFPALINAGQSVTAKVTFAPNSAGWNTGTISIASNASNANLAIGLQGNALKNNPLTASPSNLSFGNVAVGAHATLPVVVTNNLAGRVILTSYQASGSGFAVTGPSLPYALPHGQSVTLNATFTPQASGLANGTVFVPGAGLLVPFSGTGTSTAPGGQLSVSPPSLSFGSVDVGSSSKQTSTITATGGTVTVNSVSSSNSQYSLSGASFPLTLNAGQSAQVTVAFTPTSNGVTSATLSYMTSSSSKSTELATGTGISPQFTVNLSWNASTSSVSGYNVYRGTTSGSYTKINTTLDALTSYMDNTAASGTTYYYAATAVDSSGHESAYSSPLRVSIP